MKKIVIPILALSLVAIPFGVVSAKNMELIKLENSIEVGQTNMVGAVSGKVSEVRDFYDEDQQLVTGKKYLTIVNAENAQVVFLITEDSFNMNGIALDKIKVGDPFVGFYDATLATIMIYPQQFHAIAFNVGNSNEKMVKVDVFNEDLISSDGQLKLNISDKTSIVLKSGEIYTGELRGKTLAVEYTVVLESYPAQTTPVKITVLDQDEMEAVVNPISSITGKITEINKIYDNNNKAVKDKKLIYIEGENELISTFVVSTDSYFITENNMNSIKVGDTFTGYFDNTKPMIMIYPAQYQAIAVAANVKKANIKVDIFNDENISSDGTLKLNIAKFTKVIDQNGKKYSGEFTDKNVIVLYKTSTRSIPAQTSPFKIIVLNDLK